MLLDKSLHGSFRPGLHLEAGTVGIYNINDSLIKSVLKSFVFIIVSFNVLTLRIYKGLSLLGPDFIQCDMRNFEKFEFDPP